MFDSLNKKLDQCHANLENKLLDRLLKAYKDQQAQLETLKSCQDDRNSDLVQNMKKMNEKLDNNFVRNDAFVEVRQMASQLKDKLDDEFEIVARNIKGEQG